MPQILYPFDLPNEELLIPFLRLLIPFSSAIQRVPLPKKEKTRMILPFLRGRKQKLELGERKKEEPRIQNRIYIE